VLVADCSGVGIGCSVRSRVGTAEVDERPSLGSVVHAGYQKKTELDAPALNLCRIKTGKGSQCFVDVWPLYSH